MSELSTVVEILGTKSRLDNFIGATRQLLAGAESKDGQALLEALQQAEGFTGGMRATIENDPEGLKADRLVEAASAYGLNAAPVLRYFEVMVTRDTTETAVIPVAATCAREAAREATDSDTEMRYDHLFTANEGNVGETAYLGGDLDDVDEIGRERYEATALSPGQHQDKTIWFEAWAGPGEVFGPQPRFAAYTVTEPRLRRILALERLREANGLSEVRVTEGPRWENEDEMSFTLEELVVAGGQFYFVAYPKHQDLTVETQPMGIDHLLKSMSEPGVYYCASEPDHLKDIVADAPSPAPAP